jgi:hypothetical protein
VLSGNCWVVRVVSIHQVDLLVMGLRPSIDRRWAA